MPLTKEKLIGVVATLNGYQKNRATEIVETLIEIIKAKLASDDRVGNQPITLQTGQGSGHVPF